MEARRTAVYASKGEYIFVLDSDDFLCEIALENLINNSENLCYETFVNDKFSKIMCAKLIKRECYLEALDKIPLTYCNMNEEILQMFFISLYAKSYNGIDNLVYYYRDNSGMTASYVTLDLHKFETLCSSSAVFTIIYLWLEEEKSKLGNYPVNDEIVAIIKKLIRQKVYAGLENMNSLKEEDKSQGYKILCEIWGENLVKEIQNKQQKPYHE